MGKGPQYERDEARAISLWWTQDLAEPRDDIFWRTPQSGGRATSRTKRGKTTAGHYGDLLATDLIGKPFLEVFTVELKRGYTRKTIHDLLDTPKTVQQYEKWFTKARKDAETAGSMGWMLISRRDKHTPLVFIPASNINLSFINSINACATLYDTEEEIDVYPYDRFFGSLKPSEVRAELIQYKKRITCDSE